jgi:hypothetical protein
MTPNESDFFFSLRSFEIEDLQKAGCSYPDACKPRPGALLDFIMVAVIG